MESKETNFVLYRCYASGRPRPMKESEQRAIVSFYAEECSAEDPDGVYELRGVVLDKEGREVVLKTWRRGEKMRARTHGDL